MKRKVSIQKGFVFGVTAVAVVAILTGAVMRMSTISASTIYGTNFNPTSNLALQCTNTVNLASKVASETTAEEKDLVGETAKAWNVKINGNRAPFRLVVGATKQADGYVRYKARLTWLGAPELGYGTTYTNRIYFVFDDGMAYEKKYDTITINEPWQGYISRYYQTGNLAIMFAGIHWDGCVKDVLQIGPALASPTVSPSAQRSQSARPSVTPSRTVSATRSRTASATTSRSAVAPPSVSVVPLASVDPKTLTQGVKTIFYSDKNLKSAVAAKKVANIGYNWGNQSPAQGIKVDGWSDKSVAKLLAPETGDYNIGVVYNDGVRVWLGGRKVIEDWTDWAPCTTSASCNNEQQIKKRSVKVHMEKGKMYNLYVEHYDNNLKAVAKLFWKLPGAATGSIIPSTAYFTDYNPNPAHGKGSGLLGSYFNSKALDTFRFSRKDATINFNWGLNAPQADMNKDDFSVRWTGKVRPRFSEEYTIQVTAKDGVKLWVKDMTVPLIDEWKDTTGSKIYSAKIKMGAGKLYPIKLEYYNAAEAASVRLSWKSPSEKSVTIPASDLYYPGNAGISTVPSATVSESPTESPSAIPSETTSVGPSVTPSVSPSVEAAPVSLTLKQGWNAVSIPDGRGPVSPKFLTVDPYNFLTFAFNSTEKNESGKISRTWDSNPSLFHSKMGYYIKNTSNAPEVITFNGQEKTPNNAVIYRGWNLIANTSTEPVKLSSLIYSRKKCEDTSENPITCQATPSDVSLGDLTFGKPGEGKDAFTKLYYVAKPNANNSTPDPFTIYDVANAGGPQNITIPARDPESEQSGIFWLYLFN